MFDRLSSSQLLPIHEASSDGRADQKLLNEIAVKEFHLSQRGPDVAVAVAAIKALTQVIRHSSATTMMGLVKEVEDAASALQKVIPTALSLKAGCELFLRYTTRTSALELESFEQAKNHLIERGMHFAEVSTRYAFSFTCKERQCFPWETRPEL